ncbi:hypothetical protein AMTR_s00064p00024250 [Amborella trichopoda]|uniref:Uncharacterized protein n=1 Tax=Amborella trichopoda TaxID=13333 RepID=U5DH26_AMBTC|nr:hypothetical protein AMTR_s00064p00024250 [Amborella trichopoda]
MTPPLIAWSEGESFVTNAGGSVLIVPGPPLGTGSSLVALPLELSGLEGLMPRVHVGESSFERNTSHPTTLVLVGGAPLPNA